MDYWSVQVCRRISAMKGGCSLFYCAARKGSWFDHCCSHSIEAHSWQKSHWGISMLQLALLSTSSTGWLKLNRSFFITPYEFIYRLKWNYSFNIGQSNNSKIVSKWHIFHFKVPPELLSIRVPNFCKISQFFQKF